MTSSASYRTQNAKTGRSKRPDIAQLEEKGPARLRAIKDRVDGWEHKLNDFCRDVHPILMYWAVCFRWNLPNIVDLAEEATQKYLLRFISTGVSKYQCEHPIVPFMRSGLEAFCIDVRRYYRRRATPQNIEFDSKPAHFIFDIPADNDARKLIFQKIDELPNDDRRLIFLFINGLSPQDVTRELNISSVGACNTRLCRIRDELYKSIFHQLRPKKTSRSNTVPNIPNTLTGGP